VPPEAVLPIFIVVVLLVALLISYPWIVLSVGTVIYLAALPLGLQAYRKYERKDAEAAAAAAATDTHADFAPPTSPANDERPARLN